MRPTFRRHTHSRGTTLLEHSSEDAPLVHEVAAADAVSAPRPQVSEYAAAARERRAANRAAVDADEQTAQAMAVAVVAGARCALTVEDAAPVCELVVAVRRVAARKGVYVSEPNLQQVIETCEDLGT